MPNIWWWDTICYCWTVLPIWHYSRTVGTVWFAEVSVSVPKCILPKCLGLEVSGSRGFGLLLWELAVKSETLLQQSSLITKPTGMWSEKLQPELTVCFLHFWFEVSCLLFRFVVFMQPVLLSTHVKVNCHVYLVMNTKLCMIWWQFCTCRSAGRGVATASQLPVSDPLSNVDFYAAYVGESLSEDGMLFTS